MAQSTKYRPVKLEDITKWIIEYIFSLASSKTRQNFLSWIMGKIARITFPSGLLKILLLQYAQYYDVNLEEASKDLESYKTLNEFFTRELNPVYRPIEQTPAAVISPVDGRIQNYGKLERNRLIQAKGIDYSLEQLVPSKFSEKFREGQFVTIYLSPREAHRIFAPDDGRIIGSTYVPGYLFPVNHVYSGQIKGLYAMNERLITYFQTRHGCVALVKVGAYGSGAITTTYDSSIRTNKFFRKAEETVYLRPASIRRGQHLATFNTGSTVILLFQKNSMSFDANLDHKVVNYGQRIGRWI